MFKATIHVTLRKSVLDPQGQTVLHSLESLGYKDAKKLRVGKFFEMEIEAPNREKAEVRIREMCEKILTNPVIEDYSFQISQ